MSGQASWQAGFYVDEGTFRTVPAHFMWPVSVSGVGQGINTSNVVFCPSRHAGEEREEEKRVLCCVVLCCVVVVAVCCRR